MTPELERALIRTVQAICANGFALGVLTFVFPPNGDSVTMAVWLMTLGAIGFAFNWDSKAWGSKP